MANLAPWLTVGVSMKSTDLGGGDYTSTRSADQILAAIGADFTVDAAPVHARIGDSFVEVPGKAATYRTDTERVFGVVGDGYGIVQNDRIVDTLSLLVDEGQAEFVAGGIRREGAEMFLMAKMPNSVTIGGVDVVDHYLYATNAHDGSGALRIHVTPVRLHCTNMMRLAIRSAIASISIRHTATADERATVSAVREALGMAYAYDEAFEAEAQRLYAKPASTGTLFEVSDRVFGTRSEDSARSQAAYDRRREALFGLWSAEHNANVRNTAWGVLNVIGEYADYHSPVRGRSHTAKMVNRADRVLDGRTDGVKDKAFRVLTTA